MNAGSDPDADETAELDAIGELARRRGFFFPANEAYGGTAGFYTYGPEGAALKRNVEEAWRDLFVRREGHMEVTSPDVMPEAVFEASGHLEDFDDMILECPDCGESLRADHLVEDATGVEEAESMPTEDVEALVAEHDLACPTCNASLTDVPVEGFNLMFETSIGPGSSEPGYLRPETAQGIFVEFPRLKEYARTQLPFGVAQVGTAWRNEISPRRALVRVREFTQAELEHFVHPERDDPPLSTVADEELVLYPAAAQTSEDGDHRRMTVSEAVEEGVVESPWIAYYLGLSAGWYERIGVDMSRFRYRQHLPGERAHYATDCWDAEAELGGNWVELTGFAYRSDYDLRKHGEHSQEDFTLFVQYDEPRTVERATVDPDMGYFGPEYGGLAEDIAAAIEDLAARDPGAFLGEPSEDGDVQADGELTADGDTEDGGDAEDGGNAEDSGDVEDWAEVEGEVEVEVDGDTYAVPVEKTGFDVEEVRETGEHVTPHVVEPSFGVGRLVYTVLTHNYSRDVVADEERTYLDLPPGLAPTTVGVFPLMAKDGLDDRARDIESRLRDGGFDVSYDESGNIGRRYRRQDEVGTPYCVTVDYRTLEDDTVTVRDRDSTRQARVPLDDLGETLWTLRAGESGFGDLLEQYEPVESS